MHPGTLETRASDSAHQTTRSASSTADTVCHARLTSQPLGTAVSAPGPAPAVCGVGRYNFWQADRGARILGVPCAAYHGNHVLLLDPGSGQCHRFTPTSGELPKDILDHLADNEPMVPRSTDKTVKT